MNSQKIFSTLFLTGLLALSSITAQAQSANGPAEFKKRLLEKLATGERTQPAEHSRSTAERENQPRTAQHIRSVESDDQTSAESAQAAREPGSGRVESLIDVRARLKKALVGSWLVKFHAPDGDPLTDFLGLVTYHDDGTLTLSSQIDITTDPPFITSVAHGVWDLQGGRVFDATFVALVVDLKGNLLAVFKVSQHIVLDESTDKFTSSINATATDPDGNTFSLAPGTIDGTRIKSGS